MSCVPITLEIGGGKRLSFMWDLEDTGTTVESFVERIREDLCLPNFTQEALVTQLTWQLKLGIFVREWAPTVPERPACFNLVVRRGRRLVEDNVSWLVVGGTTGCGFGESIVGQGKATYDVYARQVVSDLCLSQTWIPFIRRVVCEGVYWEHIKGYARSLGITSGWATEDGACSQRPLLGSHLELSQAEERVFPRVSSMVTLEATWWRRALESRRVENRVHAAELVFRPKMRRRPLVRVKPSEMGRLKWFIGELPEAPPPSPAPEKCPSCGREPLPANSRQCRRCKAKAGAPSDVAPAPPPAPQPAEVEPPTGREMNDEERIRKMHKMSFSRMLAMYSAP